ncbi:TPA: hypothetical protein N0F65_010256 [Lagenidium giganteum]|uniref:Carbonic anhydrase n=1 Tax=Lagenidium giganteum TaxID=4803 RepID=A0AAV2YCB1_9STRA|nr:TPA: hypothetical protein N0F65_010256 [Lagenidium giganteum]
MRATIFALPALAIAFVGSSQAAPLWGYKPNDTTQADPPHWGKINATCDGKNQSPIDLPSNGSSLTPPTWPAEPLKFQGDCQHFNMHTLDDVVRTCSDCKVTAAYADGEKDFALTQFHAHAISEHTVDGKHYAGELHFVHQEVGGSNLLVVALLLETANHCGEKNGLSGVWQSFANTTGVEQVPVDINLGYKDLLTQAVKESSLFSYVGSLTAPPCSEGVTWWVARTPLSVSAKGFGYLTKAYSQRPATYEGRNNRPVQPLNDRKIMFR